MSNALRWWQVNPVHAAMRLKKKERVCPGMELPEYVRGSDGT